MNDSHKSQPKNQTSAFSASSNEPAPSRAGRGLLVKILLIVLGVSVASVVLLMGAIVLLRG
jgi:hypothetical protein